MPKCVLTLKKIAQFNPEIGVIKAQEALGMANNLPRTDTLEQQIQWQVMRGVLVLVRPDTFKWTKPICWEDWER